jgi:hypothetical protein
MLRRRHRARQFAWVAALAACFLAGVVAHRYFFSAPKVIHEVEYVYVQPEPKPETPPPPKDEPAVEPRLTALALEWQAAENPDRSVELNRRAGDRYLDEENDMESALRCYRRFLAGCAEQDLEISPKDNWLLVTLKNARLEGKRNAKGNG